MSAQCVTSDAGRSPISPRNPPLSTVWPWLGPPCPGSSQELLTQRSLLYNCASVLMNQRSCSHTLLPPRSLLPGSRLPHEYRSAPPPHYSWAALSVVMCADTEEKKGGVSQRARVTSPACECVHVCVSLWSRGSERGGTPADAATCATAEAAATLLTSEPSPARLSWSCLFLSAGLVYDARVWMGCLREMPAKEWLMRTSAPVWRVTPCVRTTAARGELDAWRFHDGYNGLQSVHFTEARGTLQAAVWDCTGERRHGRLWHRFVCVVVYDSLCVPWGEYFQAAAAACFPKQVSNQDRSLVGSVSGRLFIRCEWGINRQIEGEAS